MKLKNEFRKKAKEIRSLLDTKSLSEKIVINMVDTEIFEAAENIMLFHPLPGEINMLKLMEVAPNKNYFLPKMVEDDLLVCPYKIGDKLSRSKFNTEEPKTDAVSPDCLDIIFIPALMTDNDFNRLGYGKGYYDKFLSKHNPRAIRIVPIPSVLCVNKLPVEDFDIPVDVVVTEQ